VMTHNNVHRKLLQQDLGRVVLPQQRVRINTY
jgi:hypothetical protein